MKKKYADGSPVADKMQRATLRAMKALTDMRKIDPEYMEAFISELAWAFEDPDGFIAAHDPSDRDDARAALFGLRLKQ